MSTAPPGGASTTAARPISRIESDSRATMRFVGDALAFVVPLACYVATASGHAYWLDGSEFVAAASDLGISHPPGHPLAGMLGYAATLVPLGPLDFRVAMLGAVAAAFASLFFHRALVATVESLGLRAPSLSVPIGVGGAWLLSLSPGFWLEGVRPEVYALQAMLIFRVLERLIEVDRERKGQTAALVDASLCFGLALSNHHFLALLLLPAAAPTLARVVIARGKRPLIYGIVAACAGLGTYVYLPLRAAANPFLNLGEPTDPGRLFWVVSAEAFQKTHALSPTPLGERFADVAVQLGLNIGWATPFLAIGGAYLLLRNPTSRRAGGLWALTAVVFVAARAWLGFIRSNPDALGYLIPAFGAVVALAASFLAVLLGLLAGPRVLKPRKVAIALAMLAPLVAASRVPASAAQSSLAAFIDTDVFADAARRELPAGAVVLAHDPQTIFHYYGGEATERLRGDVILLPMPFLPYPGMVPRLIAAHPELRELLRGYLLSGELRQPDLQSLAALRPLLIEMDPRVPQTLYETMVPAGLYHAVLPDGATDADEALGRDRRRRAFAEIGARVPAIRDEVPTEPWDRGDAVRRPADRHTRDRLLWMRYTGALYYAGFGDLEEASLEIAHGLALNPEAAELHALGAAVVGAEDERGGIDVAPYLPGR